MFETKLIMTYVHENINLSKIISYLIINPQDF